MVDLLSPGGETHSDRYEEMEKCVHRDQDGTGHEAWGSVSCRVHISSNKESIATPLNLPLRSRIRHLLSECPPFPSPLPHLLRWPLKRMRQLRLPAPAILAENLRRDGELLAAGQ